MRNIDWFSVISLLFYLHITTQATSLEKLQKCGVLNRINEKYWLQVEHSGPTTLDGRQGSVLLTATVIGEHRIIQSCSWTFNVNGIITVFSGCSINKPYSLPWKFRQPGLKIVTVTATFAVGLLEKDQHSVKNCTSVNVTECSRDFQLVVSTSEKTFNVSKNQSHLVLDSPGLVNFTFFTFHIINPFHVCPSLSLIWNFGDGVRSDVTTKYHISLSHRYNSSGIFNMSLDVFDQSKHVENISLSIVVKDSNHDAATSNAAAIDVTLVLAVCVAGLIVFVCFVIILRKRVHKFTEIATFDFRHHDFQSEEDKVSCKPSFVRNFMNKRRSKENERLWLLPSTNSTASSFGSILPTEEL